LRLSINPAISENGKEDSYERNPGRVPFVFQSSVFETSHGFQKLASACRKGFFDKLKRETDFICLSLFVLRGRV
ncbi:MAG: hypothetical protein RR288_03960, partial [Oscillibacter sp.]